MRLTKAERKWIDDVQAVLDACPSKRLGFYTIGDPCIAIYDRTKEDKINAVLDTGSNDFCTAVDKTGANLDVFLNFPTHVHSTAG